MGRGRRRARLPAALATVLLALAGVALASPAQAQASTPVTPWCWLDADTGITRCYDSRAELDAALGGSAAGQLSSAADTDITAGAVASVYTMAVLSVDAGYGGSQLWITTASSGLCTSASAVSYTMPAGWNDQVSSFRSYGTCRTTLYHDVNLGGATYGPAASAATLGGMNDEASSYRIAA
jgi:hypothetical protein